MRPVPRGLLKVAAAVTLPLLVAAGVYAGLAFGHRPDEAALGAVAGVVAYMAVVYVLSRMVPRHRPGRHRRRPASVG